MCYKIKYSKREAETELNRAKASHKKYRKEKRIYPCTVCTGFFHLTSDEEYNEIEAIPLEELKMKDEWIRLMENKKGDSF